MQIREVLADQKFSTVCEKMKNVI